MTDRVPLENLSEILPDSNFRIHLAQNYEPQGLLPLQIESHQRTYLRHLLREFPDLWFSRSFFMPSLSWRCELPWEPSNGDETRLRWAVGILLFERDGASPSFDVWTAKNRNDQPDDVVGKPSRIIGIVQFDPHLLHVNPGQGTVGGPTGVSAGSNTEPGQAGMQRTRPDDDSPCVIELHLNLPYFARRAHWHVVETIAGVQYGLTPFRGISLFLQRGRRLDCGFVAVQSALMITGARIGARPAGVNDLIGNACSVLSSLPLLKERSSIQRRLYVKKFQEWLEAPRGSMGKSYSDLWREWLEDPGLLDLFQKGELDVPSPFELIAAALRKKPDAQNPEIADFGCSAVVEVVESKSEGKPEAAIDLIKSLLTDYLSSGFPVVVGIGNPKPRHYVNFIEQLRDDLGTERLPRAESRDDHAMLVMGCHLSRPCEVDLRTQSPTYGRSVDAFIISDLCYTPLLIVDANELAAAMIKSLDQPDPVTGKTRKIPRAEFLVVLPKTVFLSANDARKLTIDYLKGEISACPEIAEVENWQKFTIRAALFTPSRTFKRFNPVIPAAFAKVWGQYCDWILQHQQAATASALIWSVEVQRIGNQHPATDEQAAERKDWAPHDPLYTLHWLAGTEIRPIGRKREQVFENPRLVANHEERWLRLWPTQDGVDFVETRWEEKTFPAHV